MPQNKTDNDELSSVNKRLLKAHVDIKQELIKPDEIGFMPAALCHVYFPYSNPGDEETTWMRKHGNYVLSIEATKEYNPLTEQMERFGLPFGGKSRWILSVLNSLALKQNSPEIYLGNCLTEFIGDTLKLDTNGRTLKEIRNHMGRLAAADVKLTYKESANHTQRERLPIIEGFDMWYSNDPGQRSLWSNYARFSGRYYDDLKAHAVPIDLRAMWSILHKPMAIDLYTTLSYRLHSLSEKIFVSWAALKAQFGYTYKNMFHFKADFRGALTVVQNIYPTAIIKPDEDINAGFWLYPSPPPVPQKKIISAPSIEYVAVPVHQLPKPKKARKPQKSEDKGPQSVGEALQGLFGSIIAKDGEKP